MSNRTIIKRSVRLLGLKEKIKNSLNQVIFKPLGYHISRINEEIYTYDQDGLKTSHNCDFIREIRFLKAYERGVKACPEYANIHWRVHVALWAASQAIYLPGDYVECGVNRGFLTSAVMTYIDWNKLGKSFYLFDTFCGLDESLLTQEEVLLGRISQSRSQYRECYEETKENFSEFERVILVRGSLPSTLSQPLIGSIAYLSIDMNCVEPEIKSLEFFWPKLVQHGVVLLDDYAYKGHQPQKLAIDSFAAKHHVQVLSLPTGQGLIIKS